LAFPFHPTNESEPKGELSMSLIKKLSIISAASMLAVAYTGAYADLYISPVKANTKFVYYQPKPTIQSWVPGRVSFGKDLPLKMAIASTLSDPSQWRVHIQRGLPNHKVSWQGGTSTQTELNAIATQNNLFITINEDSRVVGAGKTPEISKNLAKPVSTVWYVNNQEPLSKNLSVWLKRLGYTLDWQASRDFDLKYAPVLTGAMLGKGGVLDKILKSVSTKQYQVYAVTNNLMHVVTIKGKNL
jgi:hypothetical protein